ncbi:uncharacterized protein LOC142972660 [Anticarsia gemmatalis]|uniref:uncharacterized protein LOC142972660 n=1 Tax=Anticarsia gemmatalis TaxID=129554 RepID=UPI003F761562
MFSTPLIWFFLYQIIFGYYPTSSHDIEEFRQRNSLQWLNRIIEEEVENGIRDNKKEIEDADNFVKEILKKRFKKIKKAVDKAEETWRAHFRTKFEKKQNETGDNVAGLGIFPLQAIIPRKS